MTSHVVGVSSDRNEDGDDNAESGDKTLVELEEYIHLNIKKEVLSPGENVPDSEEMENISNDETNLEPLVNVICIKREVLDEERNEDPLNESPIPLHEAINIKEEPVIEDTNPTCFKQHCEEISKKNLIDVRKKSHKRSPFNFSVDCTEVLPRKKTKRKNDSEVDHLMKSAMEGLEILQNHLTRPPEDHIETFMYYISSELREIKSPINLMEAKQSIFNIVHDIRKRELK